MDCTDEIHGSVLNLVLGYERDENGEWQNSKVARLVGNKNKLMRYTLGKIDPLGSHASYLDPWTTERKKDTVALFRIIQHLFDATD